MSSEDGRENLDRRVIGAVLIARNLFLTRAQNP